jgi:uncharacterized membrane protein YgcG
MFLRQRIISNPANQPTRPSIRTKHPVFFGNQNYLPSGFRMMNHTAAGGGGRRSRSSSVSGTKKNGGALRMLSMLDLNPKTNEDFVHRTTSGGLITLVSYVLCAVLFVTETRLYLAPHTVHELAVDSSRGETIPIDFDITLHKMPCAAISVDSMDVSGDMHLDVEHDVFKQRLSADGAPVSGSERHIVAPPTFAPHHATEGAQQQQQQHDAISSSNGTAADAASKCGSCYGADDPDHPCCATCDDVRRAYERKGWVMLEASHVAQCRGAPHGHHQQQQIDELRAQEGEGCRMWGRLDVKRVAGNVHFAPGRSYQHGSAHVHDLAPFAGRALDFSHTIKHLSFGPRYPGMANPLDGARGGGGGSGGGGSGSGADGSGGSGASGMYQYFLKVVPTAFVDEHNVTTLSNQCACFFLGGGD